MSGVALITGGQSGIGLGVAEALSRRRLHKRRARLAAARM